MLEVIPKKPAQADATKEIQKLVMEQVTGPSDAKMFMKAILTVNLKIIIYCVNHTAK